MKLPYQDTEVAKEAAKCMSAGFIEQHSNQKLRYKQICQNKNLMRTVVVLNPCEFGIRQVLDHLSPMYLSVLFTGSDCFLAR